MANYTISDILGKGFKYDQQVLPIEIPPATGTVLVSVGTADWGPLNLPTMISTGVKEFKAVFGDSEQADYSEFTEYSRIAMEYHLKKSQRGYFTRVANSNASKAYKEIIIPATVAKLTGSVNLRDGINIRSADTPKHNGVSSTGKNNLFKMAVVDTNSSIAQMTFTASTKASTILSRNIGDGIGANPQVANFSVGESITLKLDGKLYTVILTSTDDLVINSPYDNTMLADICTDLKTKFETVFPNTIPNAFPTTLTGFTAQNVFSVSGTKIAITSMEFGDESETQIIQSTLGGAGNYIFTLTNNNRGSRTPLEGAGGLVAQMNAHFDSLVGFTGMAVASSGKIILTANPANAGSSSKLQLAATSPADESLASELGFSSYGLVAGTDAVNIGKFEAFYTGTNGNKIKLITYGTYPDNILEVWYDDELMGTFAAFVHNTADINDLTNLLSLSQFTNKIVTFEYNSGTFPSERMEFTLENGNSGGAVISEGIVSNTEYLRELGKYSNIDLFDFDLIGVPGKSSEIEIKDKLTEICEIRQDCFTVIDTPMNTVSNSNNNVAVILAKNYADNIGQLNSFYQVTYFPYIIIKNPLKSSNIIVPPSVRALGGIAAADDYRKSTFGAPAGELAAVLSDIEGLTHFFELKNKDNLYADIYNSNINPISFNIQSGFFLDGNKTQQRKVNGKRLPIDRINNMRVGLYLKKEIQKEVKNFFYEPTDPQSWEDFAKMIRKKLNFLVDKRAIQSDYIIVCDASLNTDPVVNNNGMIAKIDYRPLNVIERIKVYSTVLNQKVTITPA